MVDSRLRERPRTVHREMAMNGNGQTSFGSPVLAVCGYSGSGKTTLLEAAIPRLVARGVSVAVVKHDAHGFVVDQEGKDSARLFRAGATVALRGPAEQFLRRNASSALTLEATLWDLARDHDLVLVEGHKDTPLPKVWLNGPEASSLPAGVTDTQAVLPWDTGRLSFFLAFINEWLSKAWLSRPLFAGLLVGGKSSRMGRPKQMVSFGSSTLAEIAAHALNAAVCEPGIGRGGAGQQSPDGGLVLLGAGEVPNTLQALPRLPDVPGLDGPIAGLLAAHRWAPSAAWVVAACDHPWLSATDIQALVHERRPGAWAILSRQPDGHPCPTLALYEPQSLNVLERSLLAGRPDEMGIAVLFDHPRTSIHSRLNPGSIHISTPQELMAEVERANAQLAGSLAASHSEQIPDAAAQIDQEFDWKAGWTMRELL